MNTKFFFCLKNEKKFIKLFVFLFYPFLAYRSSQSDLDRIEKNKLQKIIKMVHVERNPPESLRNGRSRGPSPNGHAGGSPDSSDDDCKYSKKKTKINNIKIVLYAGE